MLTSARREIKTQVTERGCHEVVSHKANINGYPYIKSKGKSIKIYRYAYQESKGDIPKGLVVRHTCDNRMCINPDHLILGTIADNINDAWERKRMPIGQDRTHSKLTNEQVKAILLSNEVQTDLASRFNVSASAIMKIKTGRSWNHIRKDLESSGINGGQGGNEENILSYEVGKF